MHVLECELTYSNGKNTFQDRASKLFNSLPIDIRNETNYNLFVSQTKDLKLVYATREN